MREEKDLSLRELHQLQEARREQMAQNRAAIRCRKERTHKLIVIGATLSSLIPGLEEMSDQELRKAVTDLFFQL